MPQVVENVETSVPVVTVGKRGSSPKAGALPGCATPRLEGVDPGAGHARGPLSTVMLWGSYAPADFDGVHYGMKAESFDPYVDLPSRCRERFQLALGSNREPRERLTRHGWMILDPRLPTRDPWTYQEFIRGSKAEFSVAKHGYVVSQSGWFSERSAAYLASGRPVLVQDTGFSRWLKAKDGVIAFRNADEAIAAIEVLDDSYERRCLAARAVAEEYFDSAVVLTELLERTLDQTACPDGIIRAAT
jgi:hypothetical protein